MLSDRLKTILKTMQYYGLTLAAFAIGSSGLVVLIQLMTTARITQQHREHHRMLLEQVLPMHHYDNQLLQACYLASDPLLGDDQVHRLYVAKQQGIPVAVVLESSAPEGYAGTIQLMVGSDLKGQVLGVRVLSHHETPGLGDKIDHRISTWITHFTGQALSTYPDQRWAVRKEGGMFDQLSGATITSRAVVQGVRNTLRYVLQQQPSFTHLPPCQEPQ